MSFQEFGSWEEAMDAIAKAEQAANDRATEEQRSITYGDCWLTFDGASQLVIFGRVQSLTDLRAEMRGRGMSQEETDEDVRSIVNAFARGYRFGRAYSIACVEGELGDTHVSVMTPISHSAFDDAEAVRWNWAQLLNDAYWTLDPARRERLQWVRDVHERLSSKAV